MKKLTKMLILSFLVLLFAGDKRNGDILRYVGDRTGFGACYNAAEVADSLQEQVNSLFQDIESLAIERVNGWKEYSIKTNGATA
jgi:hypothetical protein